MTVTPLALCEQGSLPGGWIPRVLRSVVHISSTVPAHVEYVNDESGTPLDTIEFLLTVLSEPLNFALFSAGGVVAVGGLVGYLYTYESAPRDIDFLREVLTADADFLPWLLRLSIGLPLVGAGFAGYFISPAVTVPADPLVSLVARLFLVGIGFTLLYGIATRLVAAVGLTAYAAVAILVTPKILLSSEYVGGFLAIILMGSGRPSVDHLLFRLREEKATLYGRLTPLQDVIGTIERRLGPYGIYTPTVLRVGLGINFVYTGLFDKLLQPSEALAVVERYGLTGVVPVDPGMWVIGAGMTELTLGVGLILGIFTRGLATVAFGVFTLTLFALPDDPVLAHISLFGLTTALLITGSGRFALDNL
jgi:uncharacterized membrane protein YphA (DoxX/SURF4 family)